MRKQFKEIRAVTVNSKTFLKKLGRLIFNILFVDYFHNDSFSNLNKDFKIVNNDSSFEVSSF